MPVASHQIPGGARVLLFTCEGCGDPASFARDADPLAAVRSGDVRLAGKWFCGRRNGEPCCVKGER